MGWRIFPRFCHIQDIWCNRGGYFAGDFTSILLNGSNQVLKGMGLADFTTVLSHFKTFGAIEEDILLADFTSILLHLNGSNQVLNHYGLADFSTAPSHSRHLVQKWRIALADFTSILLHLNGSNQVMKHYGLLADFSAALSHTRHLVQ
jgi:hypothetical protein